ncbi:MFS transporter [Secundilactobacillus collinoides]|uniref:MFS family major facilitator transporter n=1 Tax=Secundilactobacillus collinoides DSM 20515 = JCM 1123 TaxID=1423733 RepID=A0A0R2B3N0_SECCO|nr:MFS transporter [Secundilactobacillus collinoides]KRM73815.1 MFS family major facilitator transporter [Secundilactobacillus collinoides DSM 20515 = JCM 1123]
METESISLKTKLAIVSAGMISFMGILVETSLNVTMTTLSNLFNVSVGTVQWITTAYLLLVTIMMAAMAFIMRKFSFRSIFIVSASAFIVGSIVCAIANSFAILLIGRMIQALATGLATPLMFQIINVKIPNSKVGTYNGVASMLTSLSPALGPTYGGILNTMMNWRWIFWIVLPLSVIILLLGMYSIDVPVQNAEARKLDGVGMVLLSFVLVGFIWTFNEAGLAGWNSANFWVSLVVSIVLLALYALYNRNSSKHVLDFSLLKQKTVLLYLINYFVLAFVNIGISWLLPLVAEVNLKQSSMVAGLLVLPGALIGAIISPSTGSLMDRKGAFLPLMIGNSCLLLAAVLYFAFSAAMTSMILLLLFVILRIGVAFSFGNVMGAASQQVAPEKRGDINSLFNMMQQYAGAMGTVILASVVSAIELSKGSTFTQTQQGATVDYVVLIVLAAIALVSVLVNHQLQKRMAMMSGEVE